MTLIITNPVGLGYLEVDQRNVDAPLPPGTPRHFEADTYTCSHCQAIVVMHPLRTRERYRCPGCSHPICDGCEAKRFAGEACKTYAQFVEELQEKDLRQPIPSIILP